MTAEAKPNRRRKPDSSPPKEQEIPRDALLTRGFVRRLPGYIEGQRTEYGQFSGKPNWSGETGHEGKPVTIEIREIPDNALNIVVKTPGRIDVYHTKIMHDYSADRSYILYELMYSEVDTFPLAFEDMKPVSLNRRRIGLNRGQKLYFIDSDHHNWRDSNGQIFREGEVGVLGFRVIPLSERIGKSEPVFKSFETLQALMLQAKPTTPPARDW